MATNKQKKRRINRAFNCYIAPAMTDIDHVCMERGRRIKASVTKLQQRRLI